jgi:formylglycine-generating enzyme
MKQLLFLVVLFTAMSGHAQEYPEMVKVQGGIFLMGDSQGLGEKDEQPVHKVRLKSFSIAKTETTVAQWRAYCNATGLAMPDTPRWGWHDNDPIVNVSWKKAVAYCHWLSDKTGKEYHLPTEAQWEYAARGGINSHGYTYSGSSNLDSVGWYEKNSGGKAHATAQKQPNELGLYDLCGNVWEWCQDWYDKNYYSHSRRSNPEGPSSGTDNMVRGGSWYHTPSSCRIANRSVTDDDIHSPDIGFRVVCSD